LHTTVSGLAQLCRLVRGKIAPNPCYKLAAVNYRKTKIEALKKRI